VKLVAFNNPFELPWSFLALEAIVLTWAALTFRHARRAHQRGDRAAWITWLTIFVYGLVMEIVSYNFVDNFAHGQFTVMFYDRQLPLYVTAVYPVLLYTGITAARALRLPPVREAIAAGILIVSLDMPFDILGPREGWWRWFDDDPNIAYRWAGVPVTSYYWHLAFGGILAYLTARASRERTPPAWFTAPLTVATIVLGVIAFLPFHGLKALGVSDGVIVGTALGGAAACTLASALRRR
jgi:hypothetical protein